MATTLMTLLLQWMQQLASERYFWISYATFAGMLICLGVWLRQPD